MMSSMTRSRRHPAHPRLVLRPSSARWTSASLLPRYRSRHRGPRSDQTVGRDVRALSDRPVQRALRAGDVHFGVRRGQHRSAERDSPGGVKRRRAGERRALPVRNARRPAPGADPRAGLGEPERRGETARRIDERRPRRARSSLRSPSSSARPSAPRRSGASRRARRRGTAQPEGCGPSARSK